jgi:aquaporin Z
MLDLVVEFIGTFIFLSVILAVGQPIPIVVALLAAIYFGGHISGGHFNPAISTMFLAKGSLSLDKYIGYVLAQILGGLVALMFYRLNLSTKTK